MGVVKVSRRQLYGAECRRRVSAPRVGAACRRRVSAPCVGAGTLFTERPFATHRGRSPPFVAVVTPPHPRTGADTGVRPRSMKRVLQITEPEADSEDDELANKRYICASWHFKKEEERDNINEEWSHLFKVTKETWPRLTLCNRHHAISQGMSQAYDGDDRFINLLHAWMIKGSPKQKRGGPFRQAVGDANVAIKTLVALRKAKKDWKRKNNLEARGGYGVTIDDGYNSYDTDYDEWDAWEESQCGDSGFGKW